MLTLSPEEIKELSTSQNVMLNSGRGHNIKHPPFAFTELGVAMLSSVLRSETAIEINRNIMRAFVALRRYALGYAELNRKLEEFMIETDMQFNEIYQALTELAGQKKRVQKTDAPAHRLFDWRRNAGKLKIKNSSNMDIEPIRSKIYEIRGQKVMLDRDLAEQYGIETKVLKRILVQDNTDTQRIMPKIACFVATNFSCT
jgi:hypothetical protein